LKTAKEIRVLGIADLERDGDDKLQALCEVSLTNLPPNLKVSLCLPVEAVLKHEVMLPQATEANLASVLGFELDRLTPFRTDQASFGYRLIARYPEHEKIKVELSVVQQDYLDKIVSRLSGLGLAVSSVYPYLPANDKRVLPASLNMLRAEQRPMSEPLFNRKARRLAVMAVFLLLAVNLYPVWQLNQTSHHLEQKIGDIRKNAQFVSEKQSLLASRLGAQDALANRKNKVPGKLVILHEITRLLPDNTWVSRLTLNDGNATLQGESFKASDLIEILEKSGYFQNVSFTSSITRNPVTSMERFEIHMELVTP
jgi:general secretion pathway protein L